MIIKENNMSSKEFDHLSVLARNGAGLSYDAKTQLHRSASWVITEESAAKVKTIALHNSQKEPCYFGGEVVDYEVVRKDSKGNTRIDFIFQGSSKFQLDKQLNWSYEQARA